MTSETSWLKKKKNKDELFPVTVGLGRCDNRSSDVRRRYLPPQQTKRDFSLNKSKRSWKFSLQHSIFANSQKNSPCTAFSSLRPPLYLSNIIFTLYPGWELIRNIVQKWLVDHFFETLKKNNCSFVWQRYNTSNQKQHVKVSLNIFSCKKTCRNRLSTKCASKNPYLLGTFFLLAVSWRQPRAPERTIFLFKLIKNVFWSVRWIPRPWSKRRCCCVSQGFWNCTVSTRLFLQETNNYKTKNFFRWHDLESPPH